jgi:hypothetical protein
VLENDVDLMIGVTRIAFAEIESERFRLFGISANADDFLGVGLFEEVKGGVNTKDSIPAEDHIGLHNISC